MAGLFTITVDDQKLQAHIRDLISVLSRADEAMTAAGKRSVQWLGERAASNLQAALRRAPDPRNDPGLLAILTDPSVSTFDAHGFDYMIPERVAAISARTAAYYRVIEGRPGSTVGTRYWVNRTNTRPLWMAYLGNPARPTFQTAQVQAGVGGRAIARGLGGRPVHFTHAIPAYNYAFRARESFVKAHLYQRWAYEELRRVGIPVVTRARPQG